MILMNGDERGYPFTFLILAADHETGSLGCDHDNINGCRGYDLAEVNIEPVREHEALVVLKVGENLISEDSSLVFIREEDLDDIGPLDRISDLHDLHTVFARSIPALARPETDHNIKPAVSQVQGLPAALGTIADHRDAFAFQHADICISFIIFF